MKRFLIFMILAALVGAFAWGEEVDFGKLLVTIDEQTDLSGLDFAAVAQLKQTDPENGNSDQSMAMFRRDADDSFSGLQLTPESKKGTGYLKSGDRMYTYDPTSRKFSFTSMKDNFSGTDAKNSDFEKSKRSADYKVTAWSEGKLGRFEVWILDLTAVNSSVTYPKQKIWVDKAAKTVLKSEDYSLSGRLLRTSLYPTYASVGKKLVATKQIFVDALVPGKRTEVSLSDVSVKPLANEVFTRAFLEKATN